MAMRDHVIRDDPRAARVSGVVHRLTRHSTVRMTDRQRFEAVGNALAEMLDFDRLTITHLPPEGAPPVPVFQRGGVVKHPPGREDRGSSATTGIGGTPLARDEQTIVANAVLETYDDSGFTGRQVITVPVVVDGHQCGLIELERTTRDERHFTANDLWIVETIGHTSTLALALMGIGTRSDAAVAWRSDELTDLMVSGATPAVVMERLSRRVAATGNCDVMLMRRESGVWIGTEPVAQDASRLRALRLLLDRLRNLQPSTTYSDPAGRAASETAMLADLVSEIHDLLEQLPELLPDQDEDAPALVFSLPPERGGPLVLVALRSGPGARLFTETDRSAIANAIHALSPALLSATLAEGLDRASAERDAILRMVRAIGVAQTTLDRIKVACRTVQLLLACDYVAITDWATEPPTIRFEAGRIAPEPVTLLHKSTVADVRRRVEPRIITDFPRVPPLDSASYPLHVAEGLKASLTFRLQWSDRTCGSLIIGYRRPHHFLPPDRQFAEAMAHVIMASLGSELSRPRRA